MKNTKDIERLQDLQAKANKAKDLLICLEDELRAEGFDRKANSLSTIITKLEIWQNTR